MKPKMIRYKKHLLRQKKTKPKKAFAAAQWTKEPNGVNFRDDVFLFWQITKINSKSGWTVDHFNTRTKAKRVKSFKEVLEIGLGRLNTRNAWFKPEYKDS